MEHGFYSKEKRKQNHILFLIGFGAIAIILISVYISWTTGISLIAIFTTWILLSIIAPFFDTPSLKKSGGLVYHSLLFLTERPKNGVITIHGGSLFDYVFVLRKDMNGRHRTNFIIHQYLEGLLRFIEEYENKESQDLTVRGTSYIINARTAERIGFKTVETSFVQKLILIVNYFNILLSYSIAKGKLAFPNLNATITFEAQLSEIIKRKEFIGNLNKKLKISLVERHSETGMLNSKD